MSDDPRTVLNIGVDPGKSGAIAVVVNEAVLTCKLDQTLHDMLAFISQLSANKTKRCVIEKVNAMPRQGVSSTFKFGQSFGQVEAAIASAGIAYKLVTPAKWQQLMRCRTKGDKNVSKAAAQRLYPHVKMTHAIADALLLATLCKERWEEL